MSDDGFKHDRIHTEKTKGAAVKKEKYDAVCEKLKRAEALLLESYHALFLADCDYLEDADGGTLGHDPQCDRCLVREKLRAYREGEE